MSVYAVIKKGEIIAYHYELEVVKKFTTLFNPNDIDIIKIKKKKEKELITDQSFSDLYLIRYGDNYLPMHLYKVAKEEKDFYDYEIKYCKDILYRILETEQISKDKDFKTITKTIKILTRILNEYDNCDIDSLMYLEQMREDYKRKINE